MARAQFDSRFASDAMVAQMRVEPDNCPKCGAVMASGVAQELRIRFDEQSEQQYDEGTIQADLAVQVCIGCDIVRGSVEATVYNGF